MIWFRITYKDGRVRWYEFPHHTDFATPLAYTLMQPVRAYVAMLWTTLTSGWSRFWFQPTDPVTLAFMRICAGLVVVYIYASCAPERLNLIGPHAWIDAQALSELQQLGHQDSSMQWWRQSVWFSVKNDTVASMLYWYLIGAGICMTIGFFSRTANMSIRMIQIHMCVIYLCSGLAKLQGETCWDGTAVLRSLMGYELAPADLRWVGSFSDTTLEWFSSLSVVATLVFEIGFAFLIWNRMLRPLLLTGALFLHIGIAATMGLFGFGLIMLTGCVSFIAPESIRWVIAVLQSPPQDQLTRHLKTVRQQLLRQIQSDRVEEEVDDQDATGIPVIERPERLASGACAF